VTKITIISAEDMERILLHLGFSRKRQVGIHVLFAHPDDRCTVDPFTKERIWDEG
jgi:predicted RNA binding protein YcfA (HicA-like mRNA interferase family)